MMRMAESVSGVQPEVLRWARESLHFTVDEVAARLKRDADEIRAWESGQLSPTFAQLETLAYKIYKRPLAAFFLPAPPYEPDAKSEFRMIPDAEMESLNWHTFYMIRLAHSLQDSLRQLSDRRSFSERKIFDDIKLDMDTDIKKSAMDIRSYLGVTLDAQKQWRTVDQALKIWRGAVEKSGIYVFKNSFKQKNVSAFCITDEDFPIIYLNNSTAKTRQIFSIFHELGHLLMQESDVVSATQFSLEAPFVERSRQAEEFCNALASEILLPSSEAQDILTPDNTNDLYIDQIADRYRISREVILRRMVDFGYFSREQYAEKVRSWAADYKSAEGSGGDYYATRATYLGQNYLNLVYRRYAEGRISGVEAADHLGVKVRSLPGLEKFVYGESST